MAKSENPYKNVKERVWTRLLTGLDPENDPCGNVDDIKDNTSFAIDVAVFETAAAILNDIEKADDFHNNAILVWLKKRWLVPVPEPEPLEIGTCNASEMEIVMPDWIYDTPTGKKAKADADEIVQSIKERRGKKLESEKRIRRRAYE